MNYCATYGKTLCGSSDAARCQNRGCYYNNIYQWTNEACEPPPTVAPTGVLSYRPGELTVRQAFDGKYLDLSKGLSARIVAQTGRSPVSGAPPFHDKPDGGACFADPDPSNPGGWAYVSNSEVDSGGVGSLRFDASGAVIDYSMVLTGTRNNCGGGKSPWGTWLSAEEDDDRGRVWECDPFGRFPGRRVELVSQGGNYESVAYDDRAGKALAFYTTEDTDAGPLTRFIPDEQEPGPHDEGRGIRGPGSYEYLVLENDGNGGTYWWASEREDANAEDAYPSVEGIDIHEGVMYFVAKGIKRLYILDLDEGTYESSSTESGAFDEQPDQVARIVGDDILYFCEDGGPGKGGVHARDGSTGRSYPVRKSNFTCHRPSSSPHRFFTVLDGSSYGSETTGLAFSPDKKRMYVSFQGFGIFEITRDDGRVFDGATLDIKYHAAD